MNINQILRNHFIRSDRATLNFRSLQPNQIIQGTIVKLFPNNQALIQIGQEQRLAQLDTALAVGEKYYFQVINHEQYIHLKVLGESLAKESTLNVETLIEQLNLPSNRTLRQFMQHLIQKQVPFDRTTLLRSLPLLSINPDQQTNFRLIERMIVQNLPLTEDTFLAQQTLLKENFTDLLHQIDEPALRALIKEMPRGQQLLNLLQDYKQPVVEQQFSRHVLQILHENEAIGKLFQDLNITKQRTSLQNQSLLALLQSREPIFNIEIPRLQQMVEQIVSNQQEIQGQIRPLLRELGQGVLTNQQAERFLQAGQVTQIIEQLRPILQLFLQAEQITVVNHQLQQRNTEPNLLNLLNVLGDDQTYEVLRQTQSNQFSPKIEFLQQIQHTLTHLGLNYEQILREGQVKEQPLTLKQTLLQMIQQQLPIDQERTQQLLHFINGLQLQSVEETNHFLYGNFVLPGEKLNLNRELYMQFQSKKTKDGTIDPNHCRILFFLDLKALDQTIIDMNVQNRVISVTVYNDQQFLKSLVKPLENRLKEQLKTLDYQLSTVTFKPLAEELEEKFINSSQSFKRNNYSEVDFRI